MDEFELYPDVYRNTYTRQNGRAYTEDGVLVYALRISLIYVDESEQGLSHFSPKLSEIIAYCEEYGPVVSVKLESGTNHRYVNKYALVTFEKAEDAFKVLEAAYKALETYFEDFDDLENGLVSPADSCEQPFCEEIIRRRLETYKGPINAEESPIFGLSDDCLKHLYGYLGLSDSYQVSKLCDRFEKLFKEAFKKVYATTELCINFLPNMTLLEKRQILKKYGNFIQNLIIAVFDDCRFTEDVQKFCPNLKKIDCGLLLKEVHTCNYFYTLITNLKSLHTILLRNIDDDNLLVLSQMKSIESLTLSEADITGLHLDAFQRLKHLKIDKCKNFNPLLLVKVFGKVPTLTKLEITHYNDIPDEVFLKMAELCGNLRELSISGYGGNIEHLASLPNLEYLDVEIGNNISDSDNFFLNLVANLKDKLRVLRLGVCQNDLTAIQKASICKLTALEELRLGSTLNTRMIVDNQFLAKMSSTKVLKRFDTKLCSSVKIKEIIDFIRNAPKLEKFGIISNCKNINSKFMFTLILSIIELLRKKSRKPKRPFHLAILHKVDELKDLISAPSDIIKVTNFL